MSESDKGSAGTVLWLRLGWYPCLYLMYAGGIAALAGRNYEALAVILASAVRAEPYAESAPVPIVVPVIGAMTDIVDAFKELPGHERYYVPRSEYLLKRQQPLLEDLLFLGRGYEELFDRFEILLALSYADSMDRKWGPPGRFAWKYSKRYGENPYNEVVKEVERSGNNWAPLKAGLFAGSSKRFLEVATAYR